MVSIVVLRRRLGRMGGREIVSLVLRAGLASLAALAVAEVVHLIVVPHLHQNFPLAVVVLVLVGVVGGAAFLAAAAALRVREVTQVLGMVRRRLGR